MKSISAIPAGAKVKFTKAFSYKFNFNLIETKWNQMKLYSRVIHHSNHYGKYITSSFSRITSISIQKLEYHYCDRILGNWKWNRSVWRCAELGFNRFSSCSLISPAAIHIYTYERQVVSSNTPQGVRINYSEMTIQYFDLKYLEYAFAFHNLSQFPLDCL